MPRNETDRDWREKVNPIFPLIVQSMQTFPRLVRSKNEIQRKQVLIEACERAISLLPEGPSDLTGIDMSDWQVKMASEPQTAWLADSAICDAFAKLLRKLKGIPRAAFKQGFSGRHWWMTNGSWSELLQESEWAESLLNVLSHLHLSVPLPEITQRVSDGDADLHDKLFRTRRGPSDNGTSAKLLERVLRPVRDRATKIVARQLLLRGDPVGHLLSLRVLLYFGWDFGLSDLTISEMHNFLVQLKLVRDSYDPETLRKFRDRIRSQIEKSRSQLPSRVAE